jgi:hypothetical protein
MNQHSILPGQSLCIPYETGLDQVQVQMTTDIPVKVLLISDYEEKKYVGGEWPDEAVACFVVTSTLHVRFIVMPLPTWWILIVNNEEREAHVALSVQCPVR